MKVKRLALNPLFLRAFAALNLPPSVSCLYFTLLTVTLLTEIITVRLHFVTHVCLGGGQHLMHRPITL
jgi:hypothetical protein